MEGAKISFSIASLAKQNGWGYGSFRLKDGSSVKLATDKIGITRLFQMNKGRLVSMEAARGDNQVAYMVSKYAKNAVSPDEADIAFIRSLDINV